MQKTVSCFEIRELLPIGMTVVVLGIGMAYGLSVIGDIRDDQCGSVALEHLDGSVCYLCPNSSFDNFASSDATCANGTVGTAGNVNVSAALGGSASFNGSNNAITGVVKIPAKLPMIVTVVVAAVIIGILVRYLMVRFA